MKRVSAKGHRNASVAVAAYYIGRTGTPKLTESLPIAKRTAQHEGWKADDSVWVDALTIVTGRHQFTEPTT